MYFYVEIISQPQPQDMRLQFCIWQEKNGDNLNLENCSYEEPVSGVPGTTASWSIKVANMWKKDGQAIEWWRPRFRTAVAIKNSAGLPVSDLEGWNWSGEDPALWYPLNMHFMVVVVAPSTQFSGWDNYLDK